MPQSLSQLLAHLVFSTKNRNPWLRENATREELHAYIGGIVKQHDGVLLRVGSVADHIHLLIILPRTVAPADLVREIKTGSSKWLKIRDTIYEGFGWQNGYGMFSVSPAHRNALEKYIDGQAEHHRAVTFQEEFRKLLEKYGIQYNEKYVWD